MKVYGIPEECPAPEPDYTNYDFDREQVREDEHRQQLTAWLRANGYTGKHTGKVYRTPIADGYAQYMIADGPKSCLIHLPYGDGWNSPDVQFLPKSEIVKRADQQAKIDAMFSAKKETAE